MKVPSTEVQNNFGQYLKIAAQQEDVIVTRKGKEMVRISCYDKENAVAEANAAYDTGDKKWTTYEEFLELTENSDLRYELIDGEVFILHSPNYYHQVVVSEIYGTFYNWFKGKKCRPLTAPFDVTLLKGKENINVVQPDIIVMCDTENIDEKGRYKGVPTLVVEVLSESTKRNDMLKKLDLYMQTDVKEYWIVDPMKKEMYVYSFNQKDIQDYKVYLHHHTMQSDVFEGLEIKLEEIFTY